MTARADEIRRKAAQMRLTAGYSDDYSTYRREMDAADQWERTRLAALEQENTDDNDN